MVHWIYAVLVCQITACLSTDRPEGLLIDELLGENSRYRRQLTPVKDLSQAVLVTVNMSLSQIRELDARHQQLTSMVWLSYEWVDEFLVWNVTERGVKCLHIQASRIWLPDVTLYNRVGKNAGTDLLSKHVLLRVCSTGDVVWKAPVLIKTSCEVHIKEYPFDVQHCNMKFGPWTYNSREVNVTYAPGTSRLENYMPNGEWEISEVEAMRQDLFYDCELCQDELYSDVTFTIILKRKPMFYLFYLLFPCALLLLLGVLSFCLPPESGEKVTMAISILLAMTVYQLIIIDNIPRTSDEIPVLNQFFSASVVLLCLSTILSVVVMNWHFNGVHGLRASGWVRSLILGRMAKLVCFFGESHQKRSSQMVENKIKEEDGPELISFINLIRDSNRVGEAGNEMTDGRISTEENNGLSILHTDPSRPDTMAHILKEIQHYKQTNEHVDNISSEWKLMALVSDRFFLIIVMAITILITIAIFSGLATFESARNI